MKVRDIMVSMGSIAEIFASSRDPFIRARVERQHTASEGGHDHNLRTQALQKKPDAHPPRLQFNASNG